MVYSIMSDGCFPIVLFAVMGPLYIFGSAICMVFCLLYGGYACCMAFVKSEDVISIVQNFLQFALIFIFCIDGWRESIGNGYQWTLDH